MARRDRDELREPAGEAGAILGPQLIVKEHPHGVEPDQPATPSSLSMRRAS